MRILLASAVALLLAPSPAAAEDKPDCGCEGDKNCLFFCGVKSPGDTGTIGSKIGNKGAGYQDRVIRQESTAPAAK
jgi:hypothetical protein